MLEGPGRKPFKQLYERHGPGLFGSGEGEYLHADEVEPGRVQLSTHALSRGSGQEAQAKILARRKGVELVRQAMERQYGRDVAATALQKLRDTAKRAPDEGITRGDLELLRKELHRKPTTFQQLYERHGPGLFGIGEGEYLHAESAGQGLVRLYARAPLIPNGSGEKALASLREESAKLVRRAMENEYGPYMAEAVFQKVRAKVSATVGRDLESDITRGDLELLHKELHRKRTTFKRLHERYGPGPSGSGEGEYLHGEDVGSGRVRLYTQAPSDIPRGSGEEGAAMSLARQTGAQFVKQAMENEYGRGAAEAALQKLHDKTGWLFERGMTRGDLELLYEELHTVTFTQIFSNLKAALIGSRDEPVLGGAEFVRQAIINEFGETVALAALAAVGKNTGRDLGKKVIFSDLELLNQELQRQRDMKELFDSFRIPSPIDRSPKVMFERFERLKKMADHDAQARFVTVVEPPDGDQRWTFAFKIGDVEIYRSGRLKYDPDQDHGKFALRQDDK